MSVLCWREIGALEPPVQRLVLELAGGKVDCDRLHAYRFTHDIERSLSGPAPDCLILESNQRSWRLWRVVR